MAIATNLLSNESVHLSTGLGGWVVYAHGLLTIDANPTDGDTVTVGSRTYTFQDTLTDTDGNVQIGATKADTQANLVAAFTLSGVGGTDYAASMVAHETVRISDFASDVATLTAIESGAGGEVATTETFTAGTNVFGAATLELGATLAVQPGAARVAEPLDSDEFGNVLRVTSGPTADTSVWSESFSVTAGQRYLLSIFSIAGSQGAARTLSFGLTYYDTSGNVVPLGATRRSVTDSLSAWQQFFTWEVAPSTAATAEVVVTWESTGTAENHYIAHPTVHDTSNFAGDFYNIAIRHIPDYMLEADINLGGGSGAAGHGTPFRRWLSTLYHPFEEATSDVIDWDYLRAVDAGDGVESLSALTDPLTADAEWLYWMAQLVGVRGTLLGTSKTPWIAFTDGGITTWTEWEEDIVPGGSGSDTTWVELEGFGEGYFDVTASLRHQIASTHNGIAAGRPETTRQYIRGLLNSSDETPWVFVRRHHRANPYKMMVCVQAAEDPDPSGSYIAGEAQQTAPLGTTAYREHGVAYAALHSYQPSEFIPSSENLATDDVSELATSTSPEAFIEDAQGRGRHIALGDFDTADDNHHGGGIGLARYYDGYALYSGAVEAVSAASATLDVTGNLVVRFLVSDVPTTMGNGDANRYFIWSDDGTTLKWAVEYVQSSGYLQLRWTDSGSTERTATSDAAPDWFDGRPFWVQVTLDVDNGASDHEVTFEVADEEAATWTQVGSTVDAGTGAVTDIYSTTPANAKVTLLDNTISTVKAAECVLYQAKVYDDTTLVYHVDLSDTSNADLFPGATSFDDAESTIGVTVAAVAEATGLDKARWLALPYTDTPYFYFGNAGAGNGDDLTISNISSADYDYTVFYLDGTDSGAVNMGTVTTYSWDATNSDVEGKAITKIEVYSAGTSTVQATFDPAEFFAGGPETVTQSYASGATHLETETWTLTRLFDTGNYYEYSSYVDRPLIQVGGGGTTTLDGRAASLLSDLEIETNRQFSVVLAYSRHWDTTGAFDILDSVGSAGVTLGFDGDDLTATLTDGTNSATLTWDESANSRIGKHNLVVLRYDPTADDVWEMIVNGTSEDTASTSTVGTVGRPTDFVVSDTTATKFWQFSYLGIFDHPITDAEIALLIEELSID